MTKQMWALQADILLIVVQVIYFSGCTANKQPSKVEATLANMAKDIVMPIEAEGRKNPLTASEQP